MNADRLLEFYKQISEAPDAIKRLRRLVLDLAVVCKTRSNNGPQKRLRIAVVAE